MKLACIAIDDEPPALQLVSRYIGQVPFLHLEGAFGDAQEALAHVQAHGTPLLFLDIRMPDLSGMDLSRMLPSESRVIFTTAYESYALESYRVDALDYLLKPFSFEEFSRAAEKARAWYALQNAQGEAPDYMFVRADHRMHKVVFAELVFVENIKDYVRLHFLDGHRLMCLMTLKSLEAELPPQFIKVHRSFIVNADHVSRASGRRLWVGAQEIPVSAAFKGLVRERFGGG